MALEQKESKKKRVSAAFRSASRDAEWLRNHPEVIKEYAEQWVVIQTGQIVAHSPDGASLTAWANINRFPGSTLCYIPHPDELDVSCIL